MPTKKQLEAEAATKAAAEAEAEAKETDDVQGQEEAEAEAEAEEVVLNEDGFPAGQPVTTEQLFAHIAATRKKTRIIPKASVALTKDAKLAEAKAALLAEAEAEKAK